MELIKKAELIVLLKSGKVLTEHYRNQRSIFYIEGRRVHGAGVHSLYKAGFLVRSTRAWNIEYRWKG